MDTGGFHKKMQQHIDCYAETDYLTELARVRDEPDLEQAALNWLALVILHGIEANADKISLELSAEGRTEVIAEYREARLTSPGRDISGKVIEIMRRITHIDADKGELPLAVGIRDSSINMEIKLKKKDDREKLVFKFPEMK